MEVLVDSYGEDNQNSNRYVWYNGSYVYSLAQSFTGNGSNLSRAVFHMASSGTSGTIYCRLYAHSGEFGTSSLPTGSALAEASKLYDDLPSLYELVEFVFPVPYTLENGVHYVIALEAEIDSTSSASVHTNTNSTGHNGNLAHRTGGGAWTAAAQDVCFYIYGTIQLPRKRMMFMWR